MTGTPETFARLLTEGVHRIRVLEGKTIRIVQDELGYLLGREGGAAVEHWRKGRLPPHLADVEKLARAIVKRGALDETWLAAFLRSAGHPAAVQLCAELFPQEATARVTAPRAAVAQPELPQRQLAVAPFSPHGIRLDWGEAPIHDQFFGREAELHTLQHWLLHERCRLVAVLGIGGIGKTSLTVQVVKSLLSEVQSYQADTDGGDRGGKGFEQIIWRSLLNAPPLPEILQQILLFLAAQPVGDLPSTLEQQIGLLLQHLQQKRCLLILDNVEGIMQREEHIGAYRPGYEAYGQLIQRLAQGEHQSCLWLTSREQPQELRLLDNTHEQIQSLWLTGISTEAGHNILKQQELVQEDKLTARLVEQYSGHPLALRLVADVVHDLYNGDVAAFMREETRIFADIRHVLDQQFARLSVLEQEILIWLAVEREPVAVQTLWEALAQPPWKRTFLEALRSLRRRCLLEKFQDNFGLQNVITEYVTERLLEAVVEELQAEALHLFMRHPLMQATAKEYVQQSQNRLILQPIAQQLVIRMGRTGTIDLLNRLLQRLRGEKTLIPSYAGGNIVNLLIHVETDLSGYDLSNLSIRQADLRNVHLPRVNFAYTDLTNSRFMDSFSSVQSVTISADGKLFAASSENGEIYIWQQVDRQLFRVFNTNTQDVQSITFSPDGSLIAGTCGDFSVRIWSVHSGHCLHTLCGHSASIKSLAFNPAATLLVSGGNDQTLRLWDTHTGQVQRIFQSHRAYSVAFSPDGGKIMSGGSDAVARIWDLHTGQERRALYGHTDAIRSVAFSPNGERIATSALDGTVRLWDAATGQEIYRIGDQTTGEISPIAFSSDGALLATCSGWQHQFRINLWHVQDGQFYTSLIGHEADMEAIAFHPNGKTLFSGGMDVTVRIWDISTRKLLHIYRGHIQRNWTIIFSPDGRTLFAGTNFPGVHRWDIESGESSTVWGQYTTNVRAMAVTPNGHTLVTGGEDYVVRLWDINSGHVSQTLVGHTDAIRGLATSRDGHLLASSSNEEICVWDLHTNRLLYQFPSRVRTRQGVSITPDGSTVASSNDKEKQIYLWDCRFDPPRKTSISLPDEITSVSISPDGQQVAGGARGHNIYLWDRQTGQLDQVLRGNKGGATCIAYHPSGRWLASASTDGSVLLWDMNTAQLYHTLAGHWLSVWCVAFSPNGQFLASCGDDGIKLWHIESGECIRTFTDRGPYRDMNITGATGISAAQRAVLKNLGAMEFAQPNSKPIS